VIARLLASALVVLAVACARTEDDRGALLSAIDRAHDSVTDVSGDADAARSAVDALEALAVRGALVEPRDRCAALYRGLLEHRRFSAEAAELLDRYERIPRDRWPDGTGEAIRATLVAAEEATARAARVRPDCERMRAELRRELTTRER
jgi:hypothetical protein